MHPYYGKSMSTNFPQLPIRWVLLHFLELWEIDGETHAFPCDEIYDRMGTGWEKSTHTMGKV